MDPTKLLADLPCRYCGLKFNPNEEKLVFENHNFHNSCFNCKLCGKFPEKSMDEMRSARDLPYCRIPCWNTAVMQRCGGCGNELKAGEALIKVGGFNSKFHKQCFKCETCKGLLGGDQKFHRKNQSAYCTNCFKAVVKENLQKS